MFEQNLRGIVGDRAEAADAEFFAFQLFQAGNAGAHENKLVKFVLHACDQHEVVAGEIGLDHRADVDDGRFAGRQGLRRYLAAAQKNRIDVETVALEQPLLFSDPNVALRKGQRRIAHGDSFQLLTPAQARVENRQQTTNF